MFVRVKKFEEFARLPEYATDGAVGADLRYCGGRSISLQQFSQTIIPTGIAVEIPCGYEGQIRPRSGLAARHGVTVLNSPGTIDCDYRGEIKVILIKLSPGMIYINHGDRIAQLVIPCIGGRVHFVEANDLTDTYRGDCGFGSTGTK